MYINQLQSGLTMHQESKQSHNHVKIKINNMKIASYTKTDTYFEFVGENGEKMIVPSVDVILIDDESGAISVKNTASRRTIGYMIK